MGVRITAKQAPPPPGSNGPNKVTITADNKGGGGGSYTANIVAKYDKTQLTPSNVSAPGQIVHEFGSNDSQVQWTNVTVRDNGTDFTFDSTCDSSYDYDCEVTNTDTNASACVTLNMACTGATPPASNTCP